MTVELDIVERRNEENLKLSKQMEDTMKKLIMDTNEPIAAPINDVNFDTANGNCIATAPTELQRFYAGKNVFITGGTGTHTQHSYYCSIAVRRTNQFLLFDCRVVPWTNVNQYLNINLMDDASC